VLSSGLVSASPPDEAVASLPRRGEDAGGGTARTSGVAKSDGPAGDSSDSPSDAPAGAQADREPDAPAGGLADRPSHAAPSSSGAPGPGVLAEKAPLQNSDFEGEIWAPGACGIAPG